MLLQGARVLHSILRLLLLLGFCWRVDLWCVRWSAESWPCEATNNGMLRRRQRLQDAWGTWERVWLPGRRIPNIPARYQWVPSIIHSRPHCTHNNCWLVHAWVTTKEYHPRLCIANCAYGALKMPVHYHYHISSEFLRHISLEAFLILLASFCEISAKTKKISSEISVGMEQNSYRVISNKMSKCRNR